MELTIVILSAFAVSVLTFFSGFGLGTLLMPVFAVFFPVEVAIAVTAIVHLVNNVFKVFLLGRAADLRTVISFALPAALSAIVGALLLGTLSSVEPLFVYNIGNRLCSITVVRLIISLLIIIFALFELVPGLDEWNLDKKYVPLGGVLSGFFGGLSGHQGALRTAFLARLSLSKEAFLGTVVVSAVLVDVARLMIYGMTFMQTDVAWLSQEGTLSLLVFATAAALLGSLLGKKLLKKIELSTIHILVGIMLLVLAVALGVGLV